MRLKFTIRKPQPRAAAVAPLNEAPVNEAPVNEAPAKPGGSAASAGKPAHKLKELGGPSGPEPTRYGDWERKGICVDF